MPNRLRKLVTPPSDPFVAERARIARRIEATAGIGLIGIASLLPLRNDVTWVDYVLYPAIAVLLGVMTLLRGRASGAAGFVGGVGFVIIVTIAAWFRQGFSSGVTSGAYALAVVVGGLLWGPGKTTLLAVFASVASAILLWHAPTRALAPLRSWGEVTAILVTLSLFVEVNLASIADRIIEAQASKKRFQQLFDASPDALILINSKAAIQLLNRQARALLKVDGTPETSLTQFPCFQGDNGALILAALESPRVSESLIPPARNDGEGALSLVPGRYHDVAVTPLSAEAGSKSELWLVTIRDVSERVSATVAHREFEARVANSKSLEALGRLAGGVAHDFNNLLTVILGTSELMLRDGQLNTRQRTNLASVSLAAERAAELTSQLLAFGRKQVLEPTIFCPNTSLTQLHPLFERLIPSNIELQVRAATDLGAARIDPARLEQVLVNLVTNACDAMPHGGILRLETSNRSIEPHASNDVAFLPNDAPFQRDYVCIVVADTGTGMDEATQAQIFEPFFTTKALGKGTGLGLATVFGIVRQSDGHIRVQSVPGHGTRFELFFPRVIGEISNQEVKSERSSSGTLRSLDILLVEDSASVRTSVATMLKAAGHRVVEAPDAVQAAGFMSNSEQHFDLLLTDVMMPQVSGPELATILRARRPLMRVLFMTGYSHGARPNADVDGKVPGRVDYLLKPFTLKKLDAKLGELFEDEAASFL